MGKLYAALALAGIVAAVYVARKAGQGAFNPASPNNVVYGGVNAIGGALVTDPEGPGKNADGSWTLGGWAYDVLHPGWADMNAPRAAVTDPLDFINSPNPNSSSTWGA